MAMLRIVCAPGAASSSTASAHDILDLALKLCTAAREIGLSVVTLKTSYSPGSASRYLTLRDAGQRHWLLRISNHRMPIKSKQPLPHLDLVSLGANAGLDEGTAFLHRIMAGQVAWFNSADLGHRAEFKRHRKRHRK